MLKNDFCNPSFGAYAIPVYDTVLVLVEDLIHVTIYAPVANTCLGFVVQQHM